MPAALARAALGAAVTFGAGVTRALIRKELGELRPWAILSLFLGLSELGGQLFQQIDMQSTATTIDLLSAINGRVYWLVALAIGTGLVTREAEEGTLAFLDGLPLGRTRVFWIKCSVTWLLLSIGPVISLGSIAALHALSHGSLDAALRADIVLGRFALHLSVIASGVLLGTAIGWLRSLSWLCIGVVSTGLSVLIDRVPRAAVLSPFALLDPPITSAPFRVDAETLLVQLALTVLWGAIGWLAFMRAGKQSSALDLSSRPVIGAAVTVLTMLALFAALSLAKLDTDGDGEDDNEADESPLAVSAGEEPRFDQGPPAQTATQHYRFSYPAANAEAALELAGQADAIYERVHALLSVPPSASIDVDGSGSLENTDGTAYFGRLRISLVSSDPAAVLAHETTHVIARRLAGDDRVWLWQKVTVLDEGLATYVERHFQHSSDERAAGRLVLAALHARRELLIDELVDPAQLARVRDDNLKYPAGEALIAAIIRLHGAEALPRLVRAFATPTLPMDLTGAQLWQATFQLAGIDLGKVFDELFREVEKDVIERSAELAAIPRLRVRVVRDDDDRIGVQVIVDPEGAAVDRLLVRFKAEPEASLDDYQTFGAEPGVPLWRDADQIMNGQVCAQPGLSFPPDQTLYEPWTCLPVSDAELYMRAAAP
jgi:hypothetical protein